MLNYNKVIKDDISHNGLSVREISPVMKLNLRGKKREFFTSVGKNLNMTHVQEYMKLNYDSSSGQDKFYFKIVPDKILGFCTSEEVVGDWRVFFPETNYNTLSFKIKNQFVPGTEGDFDPVC